MEISSKQSIARLLGFCFHVTLDFSAMPLESLVISFFFTFKILILCVEFFLSHLICKVKHLSLTVLILSLIPYQLLMLMTC